MRRQVRQRGFIQNFIIPGIVVLGVVIAGIAWLSRGDRMHTKPDEDNVQAMVIIAQAAKLQGAIERATGDGAITKSAKGVIDLSATLMQSTIMTLASFPVPPESALASPGTQWAYAQGHFRTFDASASPAAIGTDEADDVIYLVGLTPGVCASINFRLYGSNTLLTDSGSYDVQGSLSAGSQVIEGAHGKVPEINESSTREGCVKHVSAGYAYYKIVGVH